ncbi:TIGR00725 family protein [Halosegnis sp.]|uniref:TIGR00725 family protein n=1 Tax=Halosegnis sp. TaxID=2864959 RepID=UPI0035D4A636
MRVSVIGGSSVDDETAAVAERVGELLGDRDHTVVCGGYGGVMAAACRGTKRAGGQTVGILSGADPRAGNDYLDTAVATGLGNARNPLVVLNGDGVVAVDGATGTLSELGHALDYGRPVAGLNTHDCTEFDGFEAVETAAAAVDSLERRVTSSSHP